MPCYLFTYHAYATWMPDRSRGYVKRGEGVLPQDPHMHRLYKKAMTESPVEFGDLHQRCAIDCLLESQTPQRFELYCVATDATHVHALLSWRDERDPVAMRGFVKGSLSRALNSTLERRTWFGEGGSRKQVRERMHFDYLVRTYLPKHSGWKWSLAQGLYR